MGQTSSRFGVVALAKHALFVPPDVCGLVAQEVSACDSEQPNAREKRPKASPHHGRNFFSEHHTPLGSDHHIVKEGAGSQQHEIHGEVGCSRGSYADFGRFLTLKLVSDPCFSKIGGFWKWFFEINTFRKQKFAKEIAFDF